MLARLRALPATRRALIPEAFAALAVAAAAVAGLRFERIAALASRGAAGRPTADVDQAVADVRWAVGACGRRAPWRTKCFEQGLAAQWMLRRRGVPATLHYGLARDPERGLLAHVWVRSGERDVVGCENAGDFTEMARFPDEQPHRSSLPARR